MLAGWYIRGGPNHNMISYIEATKATIVTGKLSAKQNEFFYYNIAFCLREIKGVACVAFVAFQGVVCR